MMFRTGNPALRNRAFGGSAQSWNDLEAQGRYSDDTQARAAARAGNAKHMTLQGTVNKCAFTLGICILTALVGWNISISSVGEGFAFNMGANSAATWGGMLIGFVLCLVGCFNPKTTPVVAPLYAAAEGFFVGGISAFYAYFINNPGVSGEPYGMAQHGSIVTAGSNGQTFQMIAQSLNTELIFNSVLLTFGIFGGLLAAYSLKLIRPNRLFYNVIITGTIGVCFYGLIAMVASFFGSYSLLSVYDPNNHGGFALGFSILIVLLASGNLVLDFDVMNNGVRNRAPKYMEWYGSMALLVSLVWLYISILRLLAILQRRD